MIARRRFLAVAAAFAAAPGFAKTARAGMQRWQGRALGAEAEIVLTGPEQRTGPALAEVEALIREAERAFSLSDPESELSRLNGSGTLDPSPTFRRLFDIAGEVHAATGGLFDPTVQPLWRALFEGRDPTAAAAAIGWARVGVEAGRIVLAPGQALTFNGIAQGYATDLVAERLRRRGFGEILVNIGEFAGYGRAWRLGLVDPVQGLLGTRTLRDGAVATSSPAALALPGGGHILHPHGLAPLWSTVSVEAASAGLADGLSTALCLAPREEVAAIRRRLPGIRRITLVDRAGDLTSL